MDTNVKRTLVITSHLQIFCSIDSLPTSNASQFVNFLFELLSNHYSPGYADLFLGDRTPASRDQLVIFDSGSSYSYLKAQPYQALVTWVS